MACWLFFLVSEADLDSRQTFKMNDPGRQRWGPYPYHVRVPGF